jgi:hypothetical protein|tara:strand:- start:9267 stop:10454 length:1188 start_codon:yes stop_codon:yes gene_type:complete
MGKLKNIQSNQKLIKTELIPFLGEGWTATTGTSLTFTAAQRSATNGRAFSNLYTSFSLPTTCAQTESYASTWINNGMSGLMQSDIIVVSIDSSKYGELIDGRTIKFEFPTLDNPNVSHNYTIQTLYSSYYEPKAFSSDNSLEATYFGNPMVQGNVLGNPSLASTNRAFLFSDTIAGPTLSATNVSTATWAGGWQTGVIPTGYPGSSTDTFRFIDTVVSSNTPKAYAQSGDIPVGICYLDMGFMVITHPTLVNNFCYSCGTEDNTTLYAGASSGFTNLHFTASTSAQSQYYSFEKEWVLTVNIVADSGEFYITENQTAASAEAPYYGAGGLNTGMQFKTPFGEVHNIWNMSDAGATYITQIGLYDDRNQLLAIAMPDRPIKKLKNTPSNFTLKMKF